VLPNDDQQQLAHRGPAVPINSRGTPTREDVERDFLSAIALAPGGAILGRDTNAAMSVVPGQTGRS
jgi:hypothetical protein